MIHNNCLLLNVFVMEITSTLNHHSLQFEKKKNKKKLIHAHVVFSSFLGEKSLELSLKLLPYVLFMCQHCWNFQSYFCILYFQCIHEGVFSNVTGTHQKYIITTVFMMGILLRLHHIFY